MKSSTSESVLNLFFDESGKKDTKPTIMGGLCIPDKLYQREDIQMIREHIKKRNISWKKYDGDGKERRTIRNIITTFMKYEQVLKLCCINYDTSMITEHSRAFKHIRDDLDEFTIYTKFPERIAYGLLRKFGRHTSLVADIIIEEATEYKKYRLDQRIREQLNVQSIYRSENFRIRDSRFEGKGQEVGLEATDLLIGIMRTIILNPPPASRGNREKIALIMNLLSETRLYEFLSNIKYYEWTNSNELTAVEFGTYVQLFITSNHEHYNF